MLVFTLPSWYKSEKNPNSCLFIFEQMKALRMLGAKVVVLTVHTAPIQSLRKPDSRILKSEEEGVITYSTEMTAVYPSKFRDLYVKGFMKALRRLIDEAIKDFGRPDVFYAHFSFAAGVSAVRLDYGIPVVVEEHYSLLMEKEADDKLKGYIKETAEKADAFICVSDGLKNMVDFITGNPEKTKVITNMIDPCFKFMPAEKKDRFTFFSLGWLIPRKRFDLLIKAFAEEFKGENDTALRIGGSGQEQESLQNLIKQYGMEERISLIGQLGREATLEEYRKCDCFALVSQAETYGLVYREAMAVGRPVISTRHGGFGADWSDESGCLIDVDDIDQLKKAMRHIYENYESYDLKKISEKCLAECSWESVAGKIVETFASVTGKSNG